ISGQSDLSQSLNISSHEGSHAPVYRTPNYEGNQSEAVAAQKDGRHGGQWRRRGRRGYSFSSSGRYRSGTYSSPRPPTLVSFESVARATRSRLAQMEEIYRPGNGHTPNRGLVAGNDIGCTLGRH